ncbi:MAG: DNA polymerase III subunit delta' [Oscillospiraceae bacterium]|nr:DNA polymerase III subunit delta' [Oscillospiraceae bacterium]MDY5735648.1 DNA polymerase III subunit delta' [Oscillospiraceae bacterium]
MDLTVFAQTNTAQRLREAAARGTLSHALIFSGPGERMAAARYAAAAMECTARGERPCLACPDCRKVMRGIHPDVVFVRDEEHAEISVDVVRRTRADAFIRPNEGARKIYIFEDCSLLTEKDQNVLLKTVEEGPAYAAFFFCTENAAALLQTIRSRCVEVKTAPVQQGEDAGLPQAIELARVIAAGSAAGRAAFFVSLEREKIKRDALGALFEQTRLLFSAALLSLYGEAPAENEREIAALISKSLTKSQILGTIDLLRAYRSHCTYNVGTGAALGGFAVELEELF